MHDLHVIGAGPAGIFSAISALRTHKDVLVSEEHKKVAEPVHCSGLISNSGLEQIMSYIKCQKSEVILNSIKRANIHAKKESFCLSYKNEKAHVICRKSFDELLCRTYENEGGKLKLDHKICKKSDLLSKNVIGADGPISTVARIFDFEKIPRYASCWQADFEFRCEDLQAVDVFFSPQQAPGFIGWIIPVNEKCAKIGLGVGQEYDLIEAKRKFLHENKIDTSKMILKNEFRALIPICRRPRIAKKVDNYNVLLVGDSAGQVKSTSGGGIFFGTQCAKIAGQKFENPQEYEQICNKKYGFDLTLHDLVRFGFDALTEDGLDLCFKAVQGLKVDKLLNQIGEMDEYSKMIDPKIAKTWIRTILS